MPFRPHADGIILKVYLTPNAKKSALINIVERAEGEKYLKASVTTVPEDGKANKALIDLIAKSLSIPKSSISLVSGQTHREKALLIAQNPTEIKRKIQDILSG